MTRRRALVTLAIGDAYRDMFEHHCRPGWEAYCERHGLDLVVFDRPLDTSDRAAARSPAWQKLLVLGRPEVAGYEQVAWVDSDILINAEESPSVFAGVPEDHVGAVDEYASPSPDLYRLSLRRMYRRWSEAGTPFVDNLAPEDVYRHWGLPGAFDRVVQTGVLVLSPSHHEELLRAVYDRYEDKGAPEWNYEMRPLSYEILKAGRVTWLDPRFNTISMFAVSLHYPFLHHLREVPETLVRFVYTTIFVNAYFMHFAADRRHMAMVDETMADALRA